MEIFIVEVCCDSEYGCMEFVKAFRSEEDAHKWAKEQGFQCEYHGADYWFNENYYEVTKTTLF